MKTICQALFDEIFYPIPQGFVENILIKRNLNGEESFTFEVSQTNEWKGALADCYASLLQSMSISEAGKSISGLSADDKARILYKAKTLYKQIGEKFEFGQPTVYLGEVFK